MTPVLVPRGYLKIPTHQERRLSRRI
ncbi:hypothetical protein DH86_00000023 [Scytalidium sp. 3C]|nr:hypothetical protein DH86_00000023 [Scytalidium sp. 3C]